MHYAFASHENFDVGRLHFRFRNLDCCCDYCNQLAVKEGKKCQTIGCMGLVQSIFQIFENPEMTELKILMLVDLISGSGTETAVATVATNWL